MDEHSFTGVKAKSVEQGPRRKTKSLCVRSQCAFLFSFKSLKAAHHATELHLLCSVVAPNVFLVYVCCHVCFEEGGTEKAEVEIGGK